MMLFLASNNPHKCREIRQILADLPVTLISLLDRPDLVAPEENGATLEENAMWKASEIYRQTGIPTIADDSGLEVQALNGAPGVHSRRFTPEATDSANNVKLLMALQGSTERFAQFRCVIALATDTFLGTEEGVCHGTILQEPRGTAGFGYDPLFAPEGLGGKTLAEADAETKNRISHRGEALRRLPNLLRAAGIHQPPP
jgi:XTP/dITP diphosphohydrolase